MSTEQLRSFLDELCGLGVLVRNINGHYRLLPRQMERAAIEPTFSTSLCNLAQQPLRSCRS
jgi:hypothetical protein